MFGTILPLDCQKGTGGSNPPLSATQSAISAFSAEESKILRMFAHFFDLKGTGDV